MKAEEFMERMKRHFCFFRNVAVKFFFAAIILLATSSTSFSQDSKENLEQKKEQLVKEIQSLQKELDETKKSKRDSN